MNSMSPLRIFEATRAYSAIPTVLGRIFDFVELCNIFVYCRASYFRIRPLTSSRRFPHTLGLPLVSCLDSVCFTQGGARNIKCFSHFIELWNEFFRNRANYFQPGANAVLSHGSRTLNQSTNQGRPNYNNIVSVISASRQNRNRNENRRLNLLYIRGGFEFKCENAFFYEFCVTKVKFLFHVQKLETILHLLGFERTKIG